MTGEFIRVLLVEDNSDHAEIIIRYLKKDCEAVEIDWVQDGWEALDYLRRLQHGNDLNPLPTLILLDVKLPRLDGMEVLKQIKSDPILRFVPVVMLTTTEREEEILKCYGLGANGYVAKPIAARDFFEKIKNIQLYWIRTNKPARICGPASRIEVLEIR